MTDGPPVQNEKPMCVRVWLEVGHACEPRRSAAGRALALDWRVWVRGVAGRDISAFVHKVVFHLHPPSAFVYPKRVLQEPPYEIQESGCASIEIPINVYLKYSVKPKKIRLRYSLQIESNSASSSESTCVYYDFENPSEQLQKSLMRGGGEVICRVGRPVRDAGGLVVVLSDGDDSGRRHRFVEPVRCKLERKHPTERYTLRNICSKCGEPTNVDFHKLFRTVSMSDDEIKRVSELYLSFNNYEKSEDALMLPPLSDPIYRVPELPLSLRGSLTSVEANYGMQ